MTRYIPTFFEKDYGYIRDGVHDYVPIWIPSDNPEPGTGGGDSGIGDGGSEI